MTRTCVVRRENVFFSSVFFLYFLSLYKGSAPIIGQRQGGRVPGAWRGRATRVE